MTTQTDTDAGTEIGDGVIHIRHLAVGDETAVRVALRAVESGARPEEAVVRMTEVGARVLDGAEAVASADVVRVALDSAATRAAAEFTGGAEGAIRALDEAISRYLDPDSGELARQLASESGALRAEIARAFGDEHAGAVQHQIEARVRAALREAQDRLLDRLASTDDANPLSELRRVLAEAVKDSARRSDEAIERLRESVGEIRIGLERALARDEGTASAEAELLAAREGAPGKGFAFEDLVHERLCELAAAAGDACHDTSDVAGPGGSKLGDSLIEIEGAEGAPSGRIAIEVRDRRQSWRKVAADLDRAMEERAAEFAILVVRGDGNLPANREPFAEYEGDKLICVVEPGDGRMPMLTLALRYARARVRAQRRAASGAIDAAGIAEAAERARQALSGARTVHAALGGASRQLEAARSGLEALVGSVEREIARIEEGVGDGAL
jgi:hypothetical protein